jgi:hypothetical protein
MGAGVVTLAEGVRLTMIHWGVVLAQEVQAVLEVREDEWGKFGQTEAQRSRGAGKLAGERGKACSGVGGAVYLN